MLTGRAPWGSGWGKRRRLALGIGSALIAAGLVGSFATSSASAGSQTFTGTVSAGQIGTHRFELIEPARVSLSLSFADPSADLNLSVRDSTPTQLAFSGSKTANPETLVIDIPSAGSYDVRVFGKTGSSAYTLTLETGPLQLSDGPPAFSTTIGSTSRATVYPSGNDVGPGGISYIADTGNDQVVAVSATGAQLWRVGTRGLRSVGNFEDPRDVAYLAGYVYVADTGNQRIQKLDAATGVAVLSWSVPGDTPMGLSPGVDASGNPVIAVANADRSSASLYTPSGTRVVTVGGVKGSGDGQMNQPRDAITTSSGEILVVDYLNNRIARFSPTGTWLGSFGTRGALPGQLDHPYGIDLDDSGDIYVADAGNGRISVFKPTFAAKTQISLRSLDPNQSEFVRRVAVGPGGTPALYVSDLWGQRLLKVEQPANTVTPLVPATVATAGGFAEAGGVAIGGGVAMVVDTVNQRVQRYDTTTTPWTLLGSFGRRGWNNVLDGFNWPRDVAYDPATNTFWVADTKNRRITEFTPAGKSTGRVFGASNPFSAGVFTWTSAVAIVGGDAVVAEQQSNRVTRIDLATGTVLWRATGLGQVLDVDVAGGLVYAVDSTGNQVVTLAADTGAVTGTIGKGSLASAAAVTVTPDGQLWVVERYHNRLAQFSPAGTLVRRIGAAGSGVTQFRTPSRITSDAGRLYISDVYNDRVQVYAVAGAR